MRSLQQEYEHRPDVFEAILLATIFVPFLWEAYLVLGVIVLVLGVGLLSFMIAKRRALSTPTSE